MTILNQTAIMQTPLWLMIASFALLFMGSSLLIIAVITKKLKIFISSILAFSMLFVCFILGAIIEVPTGRCRYECTIDSKTSISEIYEHYKIVEKRGDLWILEDKN